jgi:flagellar biosynthesis/type III secretory pathway M-ring protein FliF/YscJ
MPAPPVADMQDDQVSLSGVETQKKLEGPDTPYQRNMLAAQQTVKEDPKLVAQVVKNWVSENE